MSIKVDRFILPRTGLRMEMMTYENGHKGYAIVDECSCDSLIGIRIRISEAEFEALRKIAREVDE